MKRRATTPTVILIVGLLSMVGFLSMFRVSDAPIFRLYLEIEKAYESELPGIKGFHCKFTGDHKKILVTPPPDFPRDSLARRRLAAIAFGRYAGLIAQAGKESKVEALVVTSPRGVAPPLADEEVSATMRDCFLTAEQMRRELEVSASVAASSRMTIKLLAPSKKGLAVLLETDSQEDAAAERAAAAVRAVRGLPLRPTYVAVFRKDGARVLETGEDVAALASGSGRP